MLNIFKKKKKVTAVAGASLALAALPSAVGAAPISFGDSSIGITTTDAIATGFNFMGLFDSWTMLVVGIIFAPVAIGFIIWLMGKLPRMGKKSS
ncbi:hypothetical protein [Paenibacillus sp. GCM10027626]|uniref:hypothetical protein n=1 Tax=Paenibacillus sp. GCM10027626 TaxID=3273411 RepID=UPI00363692A4